MSALPSPTGDHPETPPCADAPPSPVRPDLPTACDVLVVGAGPAGSAAARWLARAGLSVVLADQHAFPRDKVCGDGLIPDAHRALQRLGLFEAVMARAKRSQHLACIAPRGGRIDVPGHLAVLPRRELDDILCRGAVDAGATLLAPARFEAPVEDAQGRVVGARFKLADASHEVRAGWVILATGAVPQALIAAGMCERRTPSGVALRGYVHNPAMADRIRALEVVWHRKLAPGYGWIFPAPGGTFNIGVGVAHSHAQDADGRGSMQDVNLREVFAAFTRLYAPARQVVEGGTWLGEPGRELKGAPLRCSLEGARLSRPGMIVAGEAAGSTYAFTGEGIGKALETGILAAEAIVAGRRDRAPETAVRADYETRVAALKPRFEVYERANRVNEHPWLVDLLVWSARRSPGRLKRMAGVLDETHSPRDAVSLRGVLRALFVRR